MITITTTHEGRLRLELPATATQALPVFFGRDAMGLANQCDAGALELDTVEHILAAALAGQIVGGFAAARDVAGRLRMAQPLDARHLAAAVLKDAHQRATAA
jgi:hypothetical protein